MDIGAEIIADVMLEAWSLLIEDGIWKARHKTKEDAVRLLDISILIDLRRIASSMRVRKSKLISEIKVNWGPEVELWPFEILGEGYLGAVKSVSRVLTYQEAHITVVHMSMKRLERVEPGRGSQR